MEGRYVEDLGEGRLQCWLCPHHCRLSPGETGLCAVRRNSDGHLQTENYGLVTATALDPVEKKPLYHFYPGGYLLSLGSFGCNFACDFCQNWSISQFRPAAEKLAPAAAVEFLRATAARELRTIGMAYTYNEPTIWYEYVYDTAVLVRSAGFQNIFVSNGYVEKQPLRDLLPLLGAANIDLKSMNPRFYQRLCRGSLRKVEASIEMVAASGTHLEVTSLIIPGQNDDPREMDALARYLAGLDPRIPLHLSRFFPQYRREGEATAILSLRRLRDIAREHLEFVYIGNVAATEETRCPHCGAVLLRRVGYGLERGQLVGERCADCGEPAPFVGPVLI